MSQWFFHNPANNQRTGPLEEAAARGFAQANPSQLAWREGKIAFHGERLDEAAASFARYSELRIVIDDPALARQPVTGLFAANNPAGFARAVATVFDARMREGDGALVLERRD